ncbi:hypothetical protein PR048_025907 [Dryococelus australis]|uniref:Secreted protein n=1 Tax=Dryococelus australis TaxID=614101 RepID=A0ABQ9GJX3_9NEOP|nr:hypothetical protein PR048_025907 [Dryococelus australis]
MAMLSSTAACAAITSHTRAPGSVPNIATCGVDQSLGAPSVERPTSRFAEKLHGFTEKLHALGHHRSDSDTSTRCRTGTALYCTYRLFLSRWRHASIYPNQWCN